MRGRVALLWIVLVAAVGFGLFQVKHRVQALEEELGRLNAAIVAEQDQIHVLRAEWAYLNRPKRLEELNAEYLGLGPMAPEQRVALDGIGLRPPVAPPPEPAP
ncbi:MAG TPA: cell division protein FtsL [Alphaproteobacteria bacterium]|jgi:cell division protein FtsL